MYHNNTAFGAACLYYNRRCDLIFWNQSSWQWYKFCVPLYPVAHRTLYWYNRAVHSTWDLCIQERVVIDGVCKQYARKRKISEFHHQQFFLSISCSAFRMIWTSKSNQFGLHFTVESFEHVTLNKDYCRQEICVQVYTISKLIWEIKAIFLNVCNNGRRISPENWCVWVKQKYFHHKAFWFYRRWRSVPYANRNAIIALEFNFDIKHL